MRRRFAGSAEVPSAMSAKRERCFRDLATEGMERAAHAVRTRTSALPAHSYRSHSIGSRREALNAGYIPKKMPTDA